MPKPRVILADCSPKYDVSNAEEYGEIVRLIPGKGSPFTTETLISMLRSRLHDIKYDPKHDFICLTGYQLTTALFTATVAAMYPCFKVLMFDSTNGKYVVRELILPTEASINVT